ncbi:MAG: response regulator transcription factor [Rubrobacteraceae bacterium]|nr:response regulator transcription factor [Rubrobacteraceae bacterium]MCL6439753.1 response regulator transcription factor [Rubrobacteraceae bacterium]
MASEKATRTARVLLADDSPDYVESLYDALSDIPGVRLLEEHATDGRQAVELAQRLKPDLVLMDVRMPFMDGIEATRRIKHLLPKTPVLVLTAHEDPDYLLGALKAGAAGYVLKDAEEPDLVSAIRDVLSGRSPLDSELASNLLLRLTREDASARGVPPPTSPLTRRELDILHHVAQGKTNNEIADELYISVSAVKLHVQHIFNKLGVSDRTQAAVRGVELGLISGI